MGSPRSFLSEDYHISDFTCSGGITDLLVARAGNAGWVVVLRGRPTHGRLRRHLHRLASEDDARTWQQQPLDDGERALADVADWGPAEDWSDWADAAR